MTTTILAPAAEPVLDLDARLALRAALMDDRLNTAAIAFEVNTAHIDGADPIPAIDAAPAAIPLTPTLAPCPYTSPIATVLWEARAIIQRDGWCAGHLRDEQGATCLYGAIETAAHSYLHARDAARILLDAIRRDFRDADSIPAWNDRHGTAHLADHYLDRAADLAHTRGL